MGTAMNSMCRQVGLALGIAVVAAAVSVHPDLTAFHVNWLFMTASALAGGFVLLAIGDTKPRQGAEPVTADAVEAVAVEAVAVEAVAVEAVAVEAVAVEADEADADEVEAGEVEAVADAVSAPAAENLLCGHGVPPNRRPGYPAAAAITVIATNVTRDPAVRRAGECAGAHAGQGCGGRLNQ
jgi:hypothetical protein